MEKAKEKPPEFFKSIKTSLKSVLKHPELNTKIINDVVVKSNKIVIHTLQFLKLYLLDYYENNNQTLPIVSKELINNSMLGIAIHSHFFLMLVKIHLECLHNSLFKCF